MNQAERPASDSKSFWLRILLSAFIVYHLTVIVVLANGSSFLGRSLSPWIQAYGNFLGLNVTWNFFAPDPAHTMFIHYNIHFPDQPDGSSKDSIAGYIPPDKEKIVIDSSKRRFLYAMRYLILDEKRMKVLLGPYLCRQHPDAESVNIQNILEPIPNLDLSQLGEMRPREEATLMEHHFDCQAAPDEVDL